VVHKRSLLQYAKREEHPIVITEAHYQILFNLPSIYPKATVLLSRVVSFQDKDENHNRRRLITRELRLSTEQDESRSITISRHIESNISIIKLALARFHLWILHSPSFQNGIRKIITIEPARHANIHIYPRVLPQSLLPKDSSELSPIPFEEIRSQKRSLLVSYT